MRSRLCCARLQRLVVRRSDWSDVVNDVRSPDRTGVVRDLPTEAGGLEVPGGVLGLAERTKDEASRSCHVVSDGDDLLTSGAVVVDVVNGVPGVGVGVVFGNLRHNGASCRAAWQPGGVRTLLLRSMAAFCHRTHRLIRGEVVQIGGRAAGSKAGPRPRSHLARCRRRHAQLAHVVPGLAGGRNGLAVTPGRTRANRTWRRWLATGTYQVVGSGANGDRRWGRWWAARAREAAERPVAIR